MYAASMAMSKWKNGVGPNIEQQVLENVARAEYMDVQIYGGGRVQVRTASGALKVELHLRECTCKAWQMSVSDEDEEEDDLKVDEAKVDESKQMDFAKVDNQYRNSGQALEFKELNIHDWEAFDKGQDVHMQAAPSQVELLYNNFKIMKEKLKSQTKDTILEKYGSAADEDKLPRELLLGQSERQVEYDRAGRIIKGQEAALPKSKYEEDIYINNHTTVWVLGMFGVLGNRHTHNNR
ncbi:hypothetical protein K1719_016808 [Acacia pycnantha]|nr:hypothetical protein K1719_016808 [Acacia pycnantha]